MSSVDETTIDNIAPAENTVGDESDAVVYPPHIQKFIDI